MNVTSAKRPSSENNFADPTQRKKFAPARPTPSTVKAEEASSSKKENFEVKTQVKDSRWGGKGIRYNIIAALDWEPHLQTTFLGG